VATQSWKAKGKESCKNCATAQQPGEKKKKKKNDKKKKKK
jgi:hypothetical protein